MLASQGFKKPQVERALAALAEASKITCKEFGKTKIYIPLQDGLPELDPAVRILFGVLKTRAGGVEGKSGLQWRRFSGPEGPVGGLVLLWHAMRRDGPSAGGVPAFGQWHTPCSTGKGCKDGADRAAAARVQRCSSNSGCTPERCAVPSEACASAGAMPIPWDHGCVAGGEDGRPRPESARRGGSACTHPPFPLGPSPELGTLKSALTVQELQTQLASRQRQLEEAEAKLAGHVSGGTEVIRAEDVQTAEQASVLARGTGHANAGVEGIVCPGPSACFLFPMLFHTHTSTPGPSAEVLQGVGSVGKVQKGVSKRLEHGVGESGHLQPGAAGGTCMSCGPAPRAPACERAGVWPCMDALGTEDAARASDAAGRCMNPPTHFIARSSLEGGRPPEPSFPRSGGPGPGLPSHGPFHPLPSPPNRPTCSRRWAWTRTKASARTWHRTKPCSLAGRRHARRDLPGLHALPHPTRASASKAEWREGRRCYRRKGARGAERRGPSGGEQGNRCRATRVQAPIGGRRGGVHRQSTEEGQAGALDHSRGSFARCGSGARAPPGLPAGAVARLRQGEV